ncbi:MAG: hypothetical protein J0L52_12135 [Caulobacterales bacterium]|nr:hypothetical protein [Caulobacterales bacterium]
MTGIEAMLLRAVPMTAALVLLAACGGSSSDSAEEGGGAARAAGDAMQMAGAAATSEQTPPEGLTWIAVRDINRVYDDDNSPTDRPPLVTEPPEGMITPVDVSPDSQTDWRMDYTEAGSTQWCGTGGCRQRLFVSTPDGLVQVFDANADTVEAAGNGQIRARVHHIYCDAEPNEGGCVVTLAYDASSRRLVIVSGPDDFNPMGFAQSE